MLNDSALVRLLNPCRRRRGNGLGWTTGVIPRFGTQERNYAAWAARLGTMPHEVLRARSSIGDTSHKLPSRGTICHGMTHRLSSCEISVQLAMTVFQVAHTPPMRRVQTPLTPDGATIERFLAHCPRRRYPSRTDVFRPGDPANTLYYLISGSVSIIAEEDDGRELVLGYFGPGQFVGELGLFVESSHREVILRTRAPCELAEIGHERFYELLLSRLAPDAPKLLYALGAQISRRLLDTSRKASRLAFLDVTDRIVRTLFDLAQEPEAMSHPDGTQIRVSRQELSRLVGCSREMAGRVLKKLEADGKLHARGKTIVIYGTR